MDTLSIHNLTGEHTGKRLDNAVFLLSNLFTSRSQTIEHIRNQGVCVNTTYPKPSYRLKTGDTITIHPRSPKTKEDPQAVPRIPVVEENAHFIAINKPAGVQVHPSYARRSGTVVDWIREQHTEISPIGEDPKRPGIVHRLDKDTSGVMLIARTQDTFLALKNVFAERKAQKRYIAVAHGVFRDKNGIINAPIARSTNFRKQVIVRGNSIKYKGTAREALTEYRVIDQQGTFAVVEARPRTGRMHQIRVHLASIGHPIVGDTLYAFKSTPAFPNVTRQLLHARAISFELFGTTHHISTPLPHDIEKITKAKDYKKK